MWMTRCSIAPGVTASAGTSLPRRRWRRSSATWPRWAGGRPARLAHRVLGDLHALPRRAGGRARRRAGPGVLAPRGGAGAVGVVNGVCSVLEGVDAHWHGPVRGPQDVEVARQPGPGPSD